MEARASPLMSSTCFLEGSGEVMLTLAPDGLSWVPVASPSFLRPNLMSCQKPETCLGLVFSGKSEVKIRFWDIYAVEFAGWGQIQGTIPSAGVSLPLFRTEMYRFVVHGFQKSRGCRSTLAISSYTFGHKHLQTCQAWVEQINGCICIEAERPKNLWVFVHPMSGSGNGCKIWHTVAPIFSRAKVKTKVTVTERAGHAFDLVASCTENDLGSFDGIVAVGGDGFFNEILNGLLLSRHEPPYPLVPTEFLRSVKSDGKDEQSTSTHESNKRDSSDVNDKLHEISSKNEDDPLLSTLDHSASQLSVFSEEAGACNADQKSSSFFPNEWFRVGIIPAGSTDAIVISTTGTRDPVTSALQIIVGKRVRIDVAQVVRWEASVLSSTRYAASFAGYGFYGDVVKESEKYRWMGPKRYDYAGTKVFLEHRSYQAEVAFIEAKLSNTGAGTSCQRNESQPVQVSAGKQRKGACRVNCGICKESIRPGHLFGNGDSSSKWVRSKGCFLSVGAAVISCRNGRAPDGLVADAHLGDGFLHLILVKDCPRPSYLWHLIKLTKKGGNPLDFEFVEHHKTKAFTFVSTSDEESVWNVDGELFQARKLSARVFQGLVSLFAAGPED